MSASPEPNEAGREPEITPEEYLAAERQAEYKSEYVNGRVYAMSGASKEHNRIAVNLTIDLGQQLRGRPCELFGSDMRLRVDETGLYTYPDMSVVCGEARFADAHVDTLLNPTLLIEILSESTAAYDRHEKFAHYRSLASLREYVLVAQTHASIEHFRRDGDLWQAEFVEDLDATITLPSIGCALKLADIYERVAPFANAAPRAPRRVREPEAAEHA